MYTIDLLKAEGIPIRSRPSGIAFASLVILVPLLLGILIVGTYLDHRVTLSIQTDELARVEKVLGTLSEALEKKRALEEQKAAASGVLVDVNTALSRQMQWSPVLTTLAANMPDALVLTRLEARQEYVWHKVPAKDDPKTTIEISVPQRSLTIDVCGYDRDKTSLAVRDLQERLRSSAAMGPRLSQMTVSQESATLDGEHVVNYELNCAFGPSLE
jgi:Tfp pilus assembly protein PilN